MISTLLHLVVRSLLSFSYLPASPAGLTASLLMARTRPPEPGFRSASLAAPFLYFTPKYWVLFRTWTWPVFYLILFSNGHPPFPFPKNFHTVIFRPFLGSLDLSIGGLLIGICDFTCPEDYFPNDLQQPLSLLCGLMAHHSPGYSLGSDLPVKSFLTDKILAKAV